MARMSLQAAYDQARQWLESNDLDRAVGLVQHILEHEPHNLEAYRILGEAYLANRQLERAEETFERVLRSDPENIPAHVGLGITLERRGQLDRAVAEFEQALEIKPDMPELRSQLLRLYAEAWGSENAQLRLSRAGLARLYAKGHMLTQAIAEFRQVIADQPERYDSQVALAEALWRNEQEEEAAETCRAILAKRPEMLKANLILGYLELAAGNPEGERYWQAAYAIDPYQAVARALFETLPPAADDEPTIPEWDEEAWRRRSEELQEEPLAATRPMETMPAAAEDDRDTPVFWQVPAAPVAAGLVASQPSGPAPDEDDFLASLLSLDSPAPAAAPPAPAAPEVEEDLDLGGMDTTPFSLADLGLSEEELAPQSFAEAAETPEAPEAPTPIGEERSAEPFTPDGALDLGLDDVSPAAAQPAAWQEAPAELEELDEEGIAMTPFSLADLGLSEDEIAGLESIDELAPSPSADAAPPASPAPDEEEPEIDMQPFSLNDLGLSDEEIAGLESLETTGTPQADPVDQELSELSDLPADLQPFSMDELDLGTNDPSRSDLGELPSSLQPFSLEDVPQQPQRPRMSGLPSEEPPESPPEEDEGLPGPRGFSWQQPTQRPEPGFVSSMRAEPEPTPGSIFDKLRQKRQVVPETPPEELPPVSVGEDEHLGLFSLDDVPLRDDEGQAPPQTPLLGQSDASVSPAPEPAPEVENLEDALASGTIQPFSFADLGLSEEEVAALGLGVEEQPADAGAQTALELAQTPSEEPPQFAQTPSDEPPQFAQTPSEPSAPEPAPEVENLEDALASGTIQPFSFADLGLSEEEVAALGLGAEEQPAPELAETPSEELPQFAQTPSEEPPQFAQTPSEDPVRSEPASEPEPEVENLEDALASGTIQPFSFADLGLSEEEVAALGLGDSEDTAQASASGEAGEEAAQPETSEPVPAEGLQPFSLADLGLSDEEIGELNLDLGEEEADDSRLGLTEEELAGLDLGGDVDWSKVSQPVTSSEPPAPASEHVTSGDLEVDRLLALGREQGFVDISDIISVVQDPEAEAARIEEIGQILHSANIEIRDGDEVIDMDAEYEEEETSPAPAADVPPPPTIAGEEVTPFSLHDLGLSDEEIAMLGLGGEQPPAAGAAGDTDFAAPEETPAVPEDSLEPFSLSDLGISDAAIDPLDLAEPDSPADAPVSGTDEPPLEPFSLSELGLSDEEIAMLGLGGEQSAAESGQVSAEPEATHAAAEESAPPPRASEPPAPAQTPAPAAASGAHAHTSESTGNDMLDMFLQQLAAEPDNNLLRLSIARAGGQFGLPEWAVQQYRDLIKRGVLLEEVTADLGDMIAENDDEQILRRLHRALGDAYSKQGRFREAMVEYSWTSGGPRGSN
jgi:tetratricopeptide (TPR) repeat protein